MVTEYLTTSFEIKAVDVENRTIEGYAAITGNLDRVGDVISLGAFDRCLRSKDIKTIGVFIGHNMSELPVGIPLEIRPDAKGLFTRTLVKPTADGDELLGTAKFLLQHGQKLGESIGYQTVDSHYGKIEGKSARFLDDVELIEYSYAPSQAIANPEALVSAVKTAVKALSEGTDIAGGFAVTARDKKAELDADARNALDDSNFAWIDSEGGRHLPINDAAHVRAAMARFGQTGFDSDTARSGAWKKILTAAKKFDIDVTDESMPKSGVIMVDKKAGPEQMKALRGVVRAHEAAFDALANAADLNKKALDHLASYHTSTKNGDFDEDGDDIPIPDEKTILRWVARLDVKAGAKMSSAHLGQLHDALDTLRNLHDSQCKNDSCPHRMDNAGATDDDATDGNTGGAESGEGTDQGVGDSKTLDFYTRQLRDITKKAG